MSHGGGGDDSVDPDLTPLLDLVMQLLMFFIVNVNFVSEQVSPDIKLPTSESAKPIDKADPGAIFLNQKVKSREFMNRLAPKDAERLRNAESLVLIPAQPPMSLPEAKAWLKDKYENLQKLAKDGEVNTTIHFRPDENLELGQMFTLMNHCKVAGFKNLKVRAKIRKGTT
ncbi:MAG: biopolymer transporter ExbD [Gemmataceae bacterium]|jgi:biopolymer transport protein ExbD